MNFDFDDDPYLKQKVGCLLMAVTFMAGVLFAVICTAILGRSWR